MMFTGFRPIAPGALLLAALGACSGTQQKQAAKIPLKVEVREIAPVQWDAQLKYSGTIEAENTVSLAFSVSGRITAVYVQEGQHVSAGQLVATIETTDYENALTVAGAGLEQAEDVFKRMNELYQKKSLPERDYVAAKAGREQAVANKNMAAKRLHDTRLYAPFTGIVTAKLTEKGAMAAPGVPAFTIMKTDRVYATATVPETEIGRLATGAQTKVTVTALQQDFTGSIAIINPQADATSRTFLVKTILNNSSGKLLPGMIADMQIATGKKASIITVPVQSVVRDADDITYVFVVNDQRTAIRKRVAIGDLAGNDIIVTNGLQEGDKVVVAGQLKLKDGETVRL